MADKMTNEQVIAELRSDSPLNRARAQFSSGSARIEQAGAQRSALSPIEMRRMEFEATQKIVDAYLNATAPAAKGEE